LVVPSSRTQRPVHVEVTLRRYDVPGSVRRQDGAPGGVVARTTIHTRAVGSADMGT
jgi:hypothetical protein